MNGRKKELPPTKKQYALKEPLFIEHTREKRTPLGRFSLLFIITLCVGIAIILLFAYETGSFSSDKSEESLFDRFAYSIIANEFIDLSAKKDTYEQNTDGFYESVLDMINGILIPSKDKDNSSSTQKPNETPTLSPESIYDFDYSQVPEGETPIVPMDLSLSSNGSDYVYNSTTHTFNASKLLTSRLDLLAIPTGSAQSAPLVLIVHTHGTESYSEDGAISYLDDGGELARSDDVTKNVVSVGSVIEQTLNEHGIKAIHCTVMHDKVQYKDSYIRAEQTIRQYLEKYPSIKLVIDVHRDSVLKSTGELVRPVTLVKGQPAAQVMCVVGGSDECSSWQKNLTLALKLRDALNSKYNNLCRPPYLRSSTYNQDLAPYSILLEVGTSGNSLVEARRSARLVAEEIAKLFSNL